MFAFAFAFVVIGVVVADPVIQCSYKVDTIVVEVNFSDPHNIQTNVTDRINVTRISISEQTNYTGYVDVSTSPGSIIIPSRININGVYVGDTLRIFITSELTIKDSYKKNRYYGYGTKVSWITNLAMPGRFTYSLQRRLLETTPLADICYKNCVIYNTTTTTVVVYN